MCFSLEFNFNAYTAFLRHKLSVVYLFSNSLMIRSMPHTTDLHYNFIQNTHCIRIEMAEIHCERYMRWLRSLFSAVGECRVSEIGSRSYRIYCFHLDNSRSASNVSVKRKKNKIEKRYNEKTMNESEIIF